MALTYDAGEAARSLLPRIGSCGHVLLDGGVAEKLVNRPMTVATLSSGLEWHSLMEKLLSPECSFDQMMEMSESGSSPLKFLVDNKKASLLADDEAGATSVDKSTIMDPFSL